MRRCATGVPPLSPQCLSGLEQTHKKKKKVSDLVKALTHCRGILKRKKRKNANKLSLPDPRKKTKPKKSVGFLCGDRKCRKSNPAITRYPANFCRSAFESALNRASCCCTESRGAPD
jgi:2,3-bisphosphoglycerate-independent phosphoglycerate mutase